MLAHTLAGKKAAQMEGNVSVFCELTKLKQHSAYFISWLNLVTKYNALTAFRVKSLDAGKYADGCGLWLINRNRWSGQWKLRLSINQRRRGMGLGRWPDVSLAVDQQNYVNNKYISRQ